MQHYQSDWTSICIICLYCNSSHIKYYFEINQIKKFFPQYHTCNNIECCGHIVEFWKYTSDLKFASKLNIFLTSADKKRLLTEYIWAGDLWGTLDPLTGQWNGIVHQVSYMYIKQYISDEGIYIIINNIILKPHWRCYIFSFNVDFL